MRELDVSAATAAAPLRLVRFFDGTQSYAWVPTTSLRMLLEDEALDGKMLRSSSHRSAFAWLGQHPPPLWCGEQVG
jgi:hypothetical protein